MTKKIIKLIEEHLKRIVSTSVERFLKEQDINKLDLSNDSVMKVEFVGRDKNIKEADLIWNMLIESYSKIGGLKTYKNKEQFLRMAKYAKLAYDGENIVACAIYRNMEGSYKMVAIGCNQEQNGKNGIQSIIQSDIEQMDFHFWAEVSGAIEHYFKKYNGYPMPNLLAPKILNMSHSEIRMSNQDEVHYERQISDEWFEKMIFGIKSEEVYNMAIAAVEDYSKFMKEVNTIKEYADNGLKYSLKQAFYIIENILRAHEEDGFNELIPSWNVALHDALNTLLRANRTRTVEDYIDYCNYLIEVMPVLQLHPLIS